MLDLHITERVESRVMRWVSRMKRKMNIKFQS